mmetsp:Transcript_128717/g.364063  ORF Transcript_128717/g.364063 Transcript_128717/m.364063 type:complete len:231 (+) Transcript_128717:79-771(+)
MLPMFAPAPNGLPNLHTRRTYDLGDFGNIAGLDPEKGNADVHSMLVQFDDQSTDEGSTDLSPPWSSSAAPDSEDGMFALRDSDGQPGPIGTFDIAPGGFVGRRGSGTPTNTQFDKIQALNEQGPPLRVPTSRMPSPLAKSRVPSAPTQPAPGVPGVLATVPPHGRPGTNFGRNSLGANSLLASTTATPQQEILMPPGPEDKPLKVFMLRYECEVRHLNPTMPAKKRLPVW